MASPVVGVAERGETKRPLSGPDRASPCGLSTCGKPHYQYYRGSLRETQEAIAMKRLMKDNWQ
jgi:hypothetical protein